MAKGRGMAIIVGTGDFKYRIVEDWAKLPDGWSFKEVGAVGVDGKDNVYVLYERRAVSPLHAQRVVAKRRDLRLRRLRQCKGA